MLSTVLIIVLILLLIGALPGMWPHSRDWGGGPVGGIGLLLVILIVLILMGAI